MPNVSVEDQAPQVRADVPAFRDSAHDSAQHTARDHFAESVPDPKRWLALGVIAIAQLMVVLDASIVTIALPSASPGSLKKPVCRTVCMIRNTA